MTSSIYLLSVAIDSNVMPSIEQAGKQAFALEIRAMRDLPFLCDQLKETGHLNGTITGPTTPMSERAHLDFAVLTCTAECRQISEMCRSGGFTLELLYDFNFVMTLYERERAGSETR